MSVVRERFGESLSFHDFHRTTIRKAVVFIQPRFIAPKRFQKRSVTLTNDSYIGIMEKGLHKGSGSLPGLWTCGAAERQEFRKDFFRGVKTARAN